jgi:hypothetical protein
MRTLLAIGSYAGLAWFVGGAVVAGAFMAAMAWLGGKSQRLSLPSFLRDWFLLAILSAGLIILVSSALLQRELGVLELRSAAGAAGIMGFLTSSLFPIMYAGQGSLTRGGLVFGLVGGSVIGFLAWLGAFALLPRVHELVGIWR